MIPAKTTYLSRIRLDPFKREVRRAIASVEAMHKITCHLVGSNRQADNLLWRWEPDPQPTALLQSSTTPDRGKLPLGFSMPDPTHDMKTHIESFQDGQPIRYRIVISPTKDIRINGRNHKRRISIPRAEIPEWWGHKAEAAGLRLTDLGEPAIAMGSATLKRGKIPVVRIDGQAQIENPDRLRESILTGIGRGKAYGCGLLTVQRLRNLHSRHA